MQMEGQQSCDRFCEVKYSGTPLFLNEDLRTRHPSSFLTSIQHDTHVIKGRLTRSNRGSQIERSHQEKVSASFVRISSYRENCNLLLRDLF